MLVRILVSVSVREQHRFDHMRIRLFLVSSFAFFVPLLAAQAASSLVFCGLTSASNPFAASNCQMCHLAQTVQLVLNFLLGISIPIAVGLFAWAGVMYFTSQGNTGKIEKAHKIFGTVLLGFIITTSGWLIVQVAINALTNQTFSWNTIQCVQDEVGATVRPRSGLLSGLFNPLTTLPGGGVGVAPEVSGAPLPAGTLSEQDARAALQNAGIDVNRLQCTAGQTTQCTTLAGEPSANIATLVDLKNACPSCVITVNGAMEPHGGTNDPHAAGTAIDLAATPSLTSYIQSTYTPVPSFSGLQGYRDPAGNVYTYEPAGGPTGSTGNHFHIDFKAK